MTHRSTTPMRHPMALWALKTLLFLLGIFALFPGFDLILDPSGQSIGFPAGYLEGSPFSNYFIPGILLTVFNGFLPLAAWYALWKKPKSALMEGINPLPGKHWAWTLSLVSGSGLIIWILVQMMMVPYFFLQPMLLVWGVVMVVLCLTPGVRAFYDRLLIK